MRVAHLAAAVLAVTLPACHDTSIGGGPLPATLVTPDRGPGDGAPTLRVVGLSYSIAQQRGSLEYRYGDGVRHVLDWHIGVEADEESLFVSLKRDDTLAAYEVEMSGDRVELSVWARAGVAGGPKVEVEQTGRRLTRAVDAAGNIVVPVPSGWLDEHVIRDANSEALGRLLADPDALAAALDAVDAPMQTIRVNAADLICGSAMLANVMGPSPGSVALGMLCGGLLLLESVGCSTDVACPGDFDCDGIPDTEEGDGGGNGGGPGSGHPGLHFCH